MSESDQRQGVANSRMGFLGMAAILASALVGFNTLVVSCSSERTSRDAAQLQQIEAKQQFWTDAMRDLSDVMRAKGSAEAGRGGREWQTQCNLLAARTAPFIEETPLTTNKADDGEIEMSPELMTLSNHVFDLQNAFVNEISDESVVGANCAMIYHQVRQQKIDETDQKLATNTQVADAGLPTTGQLADAIVTRQDLITLAPPSSNGWDVDVFWCERGADELSERNFRNALALGQNLASHEQAGGSLDNYILGRIRVRMLPIVLQGQGDYRPFAGGRFVQFEKGGTADEELFAKAVASLDNGLTPVESQPAASGPATKWYLSVFYCGAGGPHRLPGPQMAAPKDAVQQNVDLRTSAR